MPNWQSIESTKRLLAAVVAAHRDNKKLLDYRKIATYYGEGATYDSIEGQFRKIRKDADQMCAEVESGILPQAPPRTTTNGKEKCDVSATPKKVRKSRASPKKDGVLSGRVTKSITPTKKRAANAVKGVKEEMESSGSSVMEGVAGGVLGEEDAQFDLSFAGEEGFAPMEFGAADLGEMEV
ncbi:hypothetical protein MMC13_006971 [Lambiella insularis]|nr:hypothetical protein [Lambiella insularis]